MTAVEAQALQCRCSVRTLSEHPFGVRSTIAVPLNFSK
jgi:hypothetical protein